MFENEPDITAARAGPPSGTRSHRPAGSPGNALTAEQLEAVGGIRKWLYETDRPVFSVQGLAGVGKTELLARIAKTPLAPLVCAPTGRAAEGVNGQDRGRGAGEKYPAQSAGDGIGSDVLEIADAPPAGRHRVRLLRVTLVYRSGDRGYELLLQSGAHLCIITSMPGHRFLIAPSSASPSMPGMLISDRITISCGSMPPASLSSASSPDPAKCRT